jgi:hypothetical protein
MLAVALRFVDTYGMNVPWGDEWYLVPYLTGDYPVTFEWLWSQDANHRIVLPRLVLVTLSRLIGCDFRAGMFLNVLSMSLLAAVMIQAAKRQRGWTSYADAFFPVALLNFGHWEVMLLGLLIQFVLSTVLAGILLVLLVRRPMPKGGGHLSSWPDVLGAVCLVLLPLTGANGLVLVPALAIWVAYTGLEQWRSASRPGRLNAVIIWSLVVAALTIFGVYFIGYVDPMELVEDAHLVRRGVWGAAETSLQILAMSLGPAGQTWWPLSGGGVLALLLVSLAALGFLWYHRPSERVRASGLFFFVCALAVLVLAMSWGRSSFGAEAGFAVRYTTLMVPMLCAVFYIWGTVGGPTSHLVQTVLFAVVCGSSAINLQKGAAGGEMVRGMLQNVENDVRAGTPSLIIADRFTKPPDFIFAGVSQRYAREEMARSLHYLNRAGVGVFRDWEDVPLRELPVPLTPIAVNQVTWNEGVGQSSGPKPSMTFALDGPRYVYAIRLRYCYAQLPEPAHFQIFWTRADRNHLIEPEHSAAKALMTGEERTLTIPVRDTIDQFRVDPDARPCAFQIPEITLLVPAPRQVDYQSSPVIGFLDLASNETLAGWAMDKTDVQRVIHLDVYDGDAKLATITADHFRPDLLAAKVANGRCGFFYSIPRHLKDGKQHNFGVTIAGTNIHLLESPRTVLLRDVASSTPAATSPISPTMGPAAPAPPSTVAGALDVVDGEHIAGWAWDPKRPNDAVEVAIYDGARLLAKVRADRFRDDFEEGVLGNRKHGFDYPMPDALKDGKPHMVRVTPSGADNELMGSPKTVTISSRGPGK